MFTIGCDPEVFLTNDSGQIVSAVGHVGGTKDVPIIVHRGAVQEDNVLAEFNTDPADNVQEFVTNIKTVLGQLRERVNPLGIEIKASHIFRKAELMRSGRQALMFGCDPDYNAYTGEQNSAPSPMQGLRTAGGHIHIGYDNPSNEESMRIARAMDLLIGVPSVLLDADTLRRRLYGAAGSMRFKSYGLEYRAVSNFWIQHTDLIEWVYHQSEKALGTEGCDDARTCINTGDTDLATSLIKRYGVMMP